MVFDYPERRGVDDVHNHYGELHLNIPPEKGAWSFTAWFEVISRDHYVLMGANLYPKHGDDVQRKGCCMWEVWYNHEHEYLNFKLNKMIW